jgi:hypothetical protein
MAPPVSGADDGALMVTSYPKATGRASWLEQASIPAALRGRVTDVAGYVITLIFTVAVCPASTLTASTLTAAA